MNETKNKRYLDWIGIVNLICIFVGFCLVAFMLMLLLSLFAFIAMYSMTNDLDFATQMIELSSKDLALYSVIGGALAFGHNILNKNIVIKDYIFVKDEDDYTSENEYEQDIE